MRRLRLAHPDPSDRATRQGVLLASHGGSLALLAPLLLPPAAGGAAGDGAAAAAALRALQAELALAAPAPAGLNPCAFRRRYARLPRGACGGQSFGKQLAGGAQGVLDGDLLAGYAWLTRRAQEAAAARAGLSRAAVLELLTAAAVSMTAL